MAQVVLNNVQKDLLGADPAFTQQVKWAILNKASFWKGVDGTAVPGGQNATSLARWSKSRHFAAIVSANPVMAEANDNTREFLIFAKNFPCVDNTVQFSTANVIAFLLADATSNFDSLADVWFDAQVTQTLF